MLLWYLLTLKVLAIAAVRDKATPGISLQSDQVKMRDLAKSKKSSDL